MFIGRQEQLELLEEKYHSPGGQLVVLYGRRRVGKTEILRQFCQGKDHIFFSCRECTDKMQRKIFSHKLLRDHPKTAQYISEFEDWGKAFHFIGELPYKGEKKLVVIDEFPYMCKGNGKLLTEFEQLWDEELKNRNLMIVLCGSAISFIEKELLAKDKPFYGRVTGVNKVQELGFYDAMKFFPKYSKWDQVMTYAVLGGVPYYLKQFDQNRSFEENIREKILTKGAVLYHEVEYLLRQELRETPIYNSIMEAIATGSHMLNEISQESRIEDISKTSVYLKHLLELGIVEREFPVSQKGMVVGTSSKGYYRLTGLFFRFWYAFGFSHYSELEMGEEEAVYQRFVKPKLMKFTEKVFGRICREYLDKRQYEADFPAQFEQMGSWWGKRKMKDSSGKVIQQETSIDLVGVCVEEETYLVGICKFEKEPFSVEAFLEILEKLPIVSKDKTIYISFFSAGGFEKGILEEVEKKEGVWIHDLEQVVGL